LLNIIDHFSKFGFSKLLKDKSAESVAIALEEIFN